MPIVSVTLIGNDLMPRTNQTKVNSAFFFFFNDPAPTKISPLSLPDALPICRPGARAHPPAVARRAAALHERRRVKGGAGMTHRRVVVVFVSALGAMGPGRVPPAAAQRSGRSEEHTSELQSQSNLVCRLLLEK